MRVLASLGHRGKVLGDGIFGEGYSKGQRICRSLRIRWRSLLNSTKYFFCSCKCPLLKQAGAVPGIQRSSWHLAHPCTFASRRTHILTSTRTGTSHRFLLRVKTNYTPEPAHPPAPSLASENQKMITFFPMDLPSFCVLNADMMESPVNSNLLFTGSNSVFAAIMDASIS